MPTLEELKKIIGALSQRDRARLFQWIRETGGETDWEVREAAFEYLAQFESPRLTVTEYLALDESDGVRYEYVSGQTFAMSGGTAAHHAIISNVVASVNTHLSGGPCQVFADGMKLHLKAGLNDVFYYPDVSVFCGHIDPKSQYLENPKLLLEVLSPTTERIDFTEKPAHYWQIATLEEYVLINQQRSEVTIERRQAGKPTSTTIYRGDAVEFQSIGLVLAMETIYRGAGLFAV